MVPQVELFSFIFWENWRHQKDISKLIDLYQFSLSLFMHVYLYANSMRAIICKVNDLLFGLSLIFQFS